VTHHDVRTPGDGPRPPSPELPSADHPELPSGDRPRLPLGRPRRLLISLALNGAAPLLAYTLLRPHVGGDAAALAIGAAIPVAFTVVTFAWRRRLDPIGALAVLAYGIALLVLVLSGGNTIVLKLHDAVVTGPIGLLCLVSVAIRRPLHLVILRFLGRRDPRLAAVARDPARRRASAVFTTLFGATFLIHFAALLALALVLPTSTFLALSRPVGLSIIAAGVASLLWYRNRLRARQPGATSGG
jgi:hypothetical protein